MVTVTGPVASAIQMDYNRAYVWTISLTAALGGLLFGYDWVVIGGAKPFYERFFHLTTPGQQGWAMSCALLGCLLGALVSGALTGRLGRKRLLIGAALLFALSSLGTGLADVFGVFVAWRMAGGMAIGLASNLSPMYIAEVSPAPLRGRLVSMNQLTLVVGILLAQFMNWFIARPIPGNFTSGDILNSWNGQLGWRWMFGVTSVPSFLFLVGMMFVPESPRWLAQQGRLIQARNILEKIGGGDYASQALAEIESSLGQLRDKYDWGALFEPKIVRILFLGIALAVFQQWCGINVIFNYAEDVFAAAGYNVSSTLFNIVITGAVNLLFTLVAVLLVDRAGRRLLLLGGALGLAVIYTLLVLLC